MTRFLLSALTIAVILMRPVAGLTDPAAEVRPVEFSSVSSGVWLHTSYRTLTGSGPFPSHGLIVVDEGGVVLVDTAWTDDETQIVLDWIAASFGVPVRYAIVTHAHDDKMGGVEALLRSSVPVYAHPMSNTLAPARNLTPADNDILFDENGFAANLPDVGVDLEVFFPGPGHTYDNIVVYLPNDRVFFGGCLIRPTAFSTLGNTNHAAIARWASSAHAAGEAFPDAEIVIPSHGAPGDRELFQHTTRLAERAAGD